MANTIVLFHGNLNTLNVFTDQLRIGFEELGYDIYLFDLEDSVQSLGKLYAYMQKNPILAMVGFNNAFFGLKTESGINVWEQLNIPCINILVDHPYWYRDILMNMPACSAVLCVDRNHMSFVERFYPNIAVNGFLAHGGTAGKKKPQPTKLRTIDVLYAGSLYAESAESQKPDFSVWKFPAEEICREAIEQLMKNTRITIEFALEEALKRRGIFLEEQELCEYLSVCGYVERVVSSHYREKVLAAVATSGISLTLFGSGWDHCEWVRLPNVKYGGMISPEEVLEKMEDTKVVLNSFPWFKDGSHERIFNGMLRGCVIASDVSGYLKEILPNGMWCGFELEDASIKELPKRLERLLQDEKCLQDMADAGYELAMEEHTWKRRAAEIHEGILMYL